MTDPIINEQDYICDVGDVTGMDPDNPMTDSAEQSHVEPTTRQQFIAALRGAYQLGTPLDDSDINEWLDDIENEARSHPVQPDTVEALREAASALLSEGGIILADRGGNPVCWLCKAHLDGEYAHRDGFACGTLEQALASLQAPND